MTKTQQTIKEQAERLTEYKRADAEIVLILREFVRGMGKTK